MLKFLGTALMVLAGIVALLSFDQHGQDPIVLSSALSAFIGGAFVLALLGIMVTLNLLDVEWRHLLTD